MQQDDLLLNKKAEEAKPKKPVRYRARHKTLGHLKEEDTKHGFMERIRVNGSESRALEPPRVGVLVMDDATDLQTIPLTQNNYRKAPGKLEDKIKAQPPRRTRTLPASSNTARMPGIGPYSVQRRSRTDGREIRHSNTDPYPSSRLENLQRVPYNTPASGVPMSLPNQILDEQEFAHLLEATAQSILQAPQPAEVGAGMEASFLTLGSGPKIAPFYEPFEPFVLEGLPNTGPEGANWHTSHEYDFSHSESSVASTSVPGYTPNILSPDGQFDLQTFDFNGQHSISQAAYQNPLLQYTSDATRTVTVPYSEISHQPLILYGGVITPQQVFDPRMQYYWPSQA